MLRNFFIRVIINAAALAITAYIMPGISTPDQLGTLLVDDFTLIIGHIIVIQ